MAQPATPTTSESLPPSDAELIAASRSGDTSAYATLYQRHAASALSLARHLMRGHAEADDAVAEAFARVLSQLRGGGGPDGAFRPYLLTTVRRVAYDRFRAEQRQVSSGDLSEYDPGEPFVDPAVAGLERRIIARAYSSLPERWRAILWHTAVEGARPAEIAELLGVTPNGAAALAYRAREGLRQAYLQMHLTGVVRQECRPVVARLAAYVRGGLSKREASGVEAHLDGCADCEAMYAELADVNSSLQSVLGPIVLGSAFAAAKGGLLGWFTGRVLWFRHAPKHQQAATAGAAVVAVALAAGLAYGLTGANGTPAARHRALPASALPAPAQPAPPPPARTAHHPATRHPAAPGPAPAAPPVSAGSGSGHQAAARHDRAAPARRRPSLRAPPAEAARRTSGEHQLRRFAVARRDRDRNFHRFQHRPDRCPDRDRGDHVAPRGHRNSGRNPRHGGTRGGAGAGRLVLPSSGLRRGLLPWTAGARRLGHQLPAGDRLADRLDRRGPVDQGERRRPSGDGEGALGCCRIWPVRQVRGPRPLCHRDRVRSVPSLPPDQHDAGQPAGRHPVGRTVLGLDGPSRRAHHAERPRCPPSQAQPLGYRQSGHRGKKRAPGVR